MHTGDLPGRGKRGSRRYAAAALCVVTAVLTACGGGGGGGSPPPPPPPPPPVEATISGTVQKGLFNNLQVTAAVVDEQSGSIGAPADATVSDQSFSVNVGRNSLVLLQATGDFQHDITGETVVLDRPLQVLVDVGATDLTANINLATHLAAAMTLSQLAAGPQDATPLIAANESFVADALGLSPADAKGLSVLDIDAGSDITDPDLVLLLFSAAVVDSLTGDSLFADGFDIIVDGFVDAPALADVAGVLEQFTGKNAQILYDEVAAAGFVGTLPPIAITSPYVYSCIPGCGWQEAPEPQINVAGRRTYESAGSVRVAVRLSEASAEDVNARVRISDVTAELNADYVGFDQDITFAPGQTELFVEVPLLIDAVAEGAETARVRIFSRTLSYGVGVGESTIYIIDGAPDVLRNQDATDLVVVDVCMVSIGLAEVLPEQDCSAGLDAIEGVGLDPSHQAGVSIDLAAACASAQDCAPQTKDWLVEFFLVSSDTSELFLGPYGYDNDSVQLQGAAGNPRSLLLSFGTPEVDAFLQTALAAGETLRLEARINSQQGLAADAALPQLIPVPGPVVAGNQLIPLGTIDSIVPGDGGTCAVGTYEMTADFIVGTDILELGNNYAASGTACISIDMISAGVYETTLVAGEVDLVGNVLNVAPGHNTRFGAAGVSGGLPIGFESVAIVGGVVDPDGNPLQNRARLHIDGLPFMFDISGGSLNSSGIEILYDNVVHVMNVGYSAQDPRANGELYSNDIVYTGLAGQSGSLQLAADRSVDATINVLAGVDHTAFPRGRLQWEAFSQTIQGGRLADSVSVDVVFTLDQSTSCRGAECAAGNDVSYDVAAAATTIDSRGFALGSGQLTGASQSVPGWGADPAGNLAWERPDDLAAPGDSLVLALPGYRLPDTPQGRASDFLLAHVSAGAGTDLGVHRLGSAAANDGNFYPVGLTVGPELYSDPQGQPVVIGGRNLSGRPLGISNGTDSASLPSSIASKYVVRNGGITGVFNIDPSGLQSPLTFFGYPFEFDRFAVRLVNNELDDYNWVDGALTLLGDAGEPSGLELVFDNLEINCGARFDAANLLYESCDAIDNNGNGRIDENCNHRLSNWRADTDIFSMGFTSGASCATGDQLLSLEQQVLFESLDGPIGLDATWNAAGDLDSYTSAVQSSYRLDEGERKGFPVRATSARIEIADVTGADNGRYGWVELPASTVGVPFWNAIRSDVRVANAFNFGVPTAEPAVFAPEGNTVVIGTATDNATLQQSIVEDSDLDLNARYEWGNTGFGFQLPVYFSPGQFNNERSQFIGRRKEVDLFVFDAGAGINFIDPERTKLSFGASADISKLKSVNLQLDLSDPENLRRVDDILVRFRIINEPVLEPALQGLLDDLSIVNRLANKGLDEVMQQGLELAVEELGDAAASVSPYGEDPFVSASKALSQVKSYPQQVLTILDDEVKGAVDEALADQRGVLQLELDELEEAILSIDAGVATPPAVLQTLDDSIDLVSTARDSAERAIDTMARSRREVENLVNLANDPLNRAETALTTIDQVMLQAVTFSRSACEMGDLSGQEASGYLDQIVIRIDSVQRIFAFIENDDLLLPLTELLNNDPELRERIEQTRRDIRTQAEELAGYLQQAEDAIKGVACNERYGELLADARALVSDVRGEVGTIRGLLAAAVSKLNAIDDIGALLEQDVLPPLDQLVTLLEEVRSELEATPQVDGDQVLAGIEARLADMTDGRINAISADDGDVARKDILDIVFDPTESAINTMYGDFRDSLVVDVTDRLAGAYFTPEELRRMFVSIIMDSQPVADLRAVMNTYFSEINYRVNNLVLLLTDQINTGVRAALDGVESEINDALDGAFAPVRNIPLDSARLDGFAVIAGNDLERAHVGAEWTMKPAAEGQSANTFGAALDVVSWAASNKAAGCSIGEDSSRLDVTISAMGIPAKFVGSDILLKKIYLGFTLGQGNGRVIPRGVFGGVSTSGDIGFSDAIVYDPAFAAGIGDIETYIGASAGATFSDIQAEVAFLVGRTCNTDILVELDPRIGDFISLPPTGFGGVYLRGGASIPLLTFGCPLTVGVGADFGAWVLAGPPATFGGLVGGSAYGKVACIGALRGQILAIGQVNTDGELFFGGEGFGAAGVGWCDPASWTTVERVRSDDLCGTGDALFRATFDNGKWKIPKPSINAIH